MYVRELLNKWDQKIIQFIVSLRQNGYRLSKKEVTRELSLTRPTLIKLVKDINSIFCALEGYKLVIKNDYYILEMSLENNLRDLFIYLLGDSRKFQIISEIFTKTTINVNYFCDTHQISRHTYYSELKEINILLTEFNLKIADNRLRGSEMQIRYFYTSLFSKTYEKKVIDQISQEYLSAHFIEEFAKRFQVDFGHSSYYELGLYFYITTKRYDRKENQKVVLEDGFANRTYALKKRNLFIHHLADSAVIEEINDIIRRNYARHHWLNNKNEQLFLLFFLMGHYDSSTHSLLYEEIVKIERDSGNYSEEVIDFFLEHSGDHKDEKLIKNTRYNLSKVLWKQLIFAGNISKERDTYSGNYKSDLCPQAVKFFEELRRTLSNQFKGIEYKNGNNKELLVNFGINYSLLIKQKKKKFHVGLFFEGSPIVVRSTMDYYLTELNRYSYITATKWQESKEYDLIVSNFEILDFKKRNSKVFYVSLSEPSFNIKKIISLAVVSSNSGLFPT
ncbi:helix-turn-helix domain-containing protein [Enterococcus sp. DIV0800]|uniref:helix-turn-helix domain-containing protein n=1 Tax=unclassified Enterococcus TaxID=2608891 RepID=UPI003D2FB49C